MYVLIALIVGVAAVGAVGAALYMRRSKNKAISYDNSVQGRVYTIDTAAYNACVTAGTDRKVCRANALTEATGTTAESDSSYVLVLALDPTESGAEASAMRTHLRDIAKSQKLRADSKALTGPRVTTRLALKTFVDGASDFAASSAKSANSSLKAIGSLTQRLLALNLLADCSAQNCRTCINGCGTGDCCQCATTPFDNCACSSALCGSPHLASTASCCTSNVTPTATCASVSASVSCTAASVIRDTVTAALCNQGDTAVTDAINVACKDYAQSCELITSLGIEPICNAVAENNLRGHINQTLGCNCLV